MLYCDVVALFSEGKRMAVSHILQSISNTIDEFKIICAVRVEKYKIGQLYHHGQRSGWLK